MHSVLAGLAWPDQVGRGPPTGWHPTSQAGFHVLPCHPAEPPTQPESVLNVQQTCAAGHVRDEVSLFRSFLIFIFGPCMQEYCSPLPSFVLSSRFPAPLPRSPAPPLNFNLPLSPCSHLHHYTQVWVANLPAINRYKVKMFPQ